MFGPKEVRIEEAQILVREEGDNPGSFLIGQGLYGVDDFYFEAQLEAGQYNYKIPINVPILVKIGAYQVKTQFKRSFKQVALENLVFTVTDQKSSSQDYIFSKDKELNLDNPLTCIFAQENLQLCDKYLSVLMDKTKEN